MTHTVGNRHVRPGVQTPSLLTLVLGPRSGRHLLNRVGTRPLSLGSSGRPKPRLLEQEDYVAKTCYFHTQ